MINDKERHGGDVYRRHISMDFSICLNPLGMPRSVIEAAQAGAAVSGRYPDPECLALREKLAVWLTGRTGETVEPDMILPGNGAAELIYALCAAVRPREVLVLRPGFTEYARAAQIGGSRVRFIELDEAAGYALPSQPEDWIGPDTDAVFLCNPNNPTGYACSGEEMRNWAGVCHAKGVRLIVDECFLPFLEDEKERTMLRSLRQFPNVLVLRAFTKIFSMAGLRLGYAVSDDVEFLEGIRERMQPWNVSIPAQMAGEAAIGRPDEAAAYLDATRKLVRTERAYLKEELERGLAAKVYPGTANFLLFRAPADLRKRLIREGILIRSFTNAEGPGAGCFRIGIRKHIDNQRLIDVMTELRATKEPGSGSMLF